MSKNQRSGKRRLNLERLWQAIDELKHKAEGLAKDPALVEKLLATATAKADLHKSQLKDLQGNLAGLLRLLKAWAGGRYTRIPWSTIVMAVTAVLYFVNPLDIIPDFVIGAGYLDDATVIAMILRAIGKDVGAFEEWEGAQH